MRVEDWLGWAGLGWGGMANHCRRGQPLVKLGGSTRGGAAGGGQLARGTRDTLNLAIGRGDETKVKQLLFDDGVDPNERIHVDSDGWTPLHRACSLGHLGIVDALLDSGADPAATDRDNRTPMHNAALIGNLEMVASLQAFNPRRSNTMVRPCAFSHSRPAGHTGRSDCRGPTCAVRQLHGANARREVPAQGHCKTDGRRPVGTSDGRRLETRRYRVMVLWQASFMPRFPRRVRCFAIECYTQQRLNEITPGAGFQSTFA